MLESEKVFSSWIRTFGGRVRFRKKGRRLRKAIVEMIVRDRNGRRCIYTKFIGLDTIRESPKISALHASLDAKMWHLYYKYDASEAVAEIVHQAGIARNSGVSSCQTIESPSK